MYNSEYLYSYILCRVREPHTTRMITNGNNGGTYVLYGGRCVSNNNHSDMAMATSVRGIGEGQLVDVEHQTLYQHRWLSQRE